MTTPHRTLLQQALDALRQCEFTSPPAQRPIVKDAITALREALAAPPAAPAPAVPASGWVWAHRKGGEYTVFGKGKIQCDAHLDDMADVVIYRSSKDGTLWARPEAEFNERFNRLRPLAAPPAAPADDHATPSGGQEAGPQEDRIEAAYWRFDARHKGYSQWKTAPMSERDAFKAEMRNALEAEKVRAEMRLVARGWRRPDAPAAPAPAAPVVPLTDEQIRSMWLSSEFRGNGGQVDWFCEGIRAAEAHHGITGGSK